ncbi:MAG: hypothetical protein HY962_08445 [Ignavibacteriae bacterium]|nr:hypothetical protein [Ignavibacteriota bacterium]
MPKPVPALRRVAVPVFRTGLVLFSVAVISLSISARATEARTAGNVGPLRGEHTTAPKVSRFSSTTGGAFFFVENRGQFADMDGARRPDLRAVLFAGDMRVFVRSGGFSFVQTARETQRDMHDAQHESGAPGLDGGTWRHERSDADFLGANPAPRFRFEDELPWYTNFYTPGAPDGVTHLAPVRRLVVENLYNGVDLVLTAGEKGLKYDFVVRPGARYQDIRIRYSSNVSPRLRADGGLSLRTSLGVIEEDAPRCWNESAVGRRVVDGRFILEGHELRFDIRGAAAGETLVIDPSLSWSTYIGSAGNDYAGAVDVDPSDNAWVVGATTGTNFPTTTGVFQYTKTGNALDGYAIKFSSSGARLWATYYSGASLSTGVRCDANGNAIYTGATNSSTFPVSAGAFQSTLASGYDAFLIKLLSDGTRGWATFYGGNGGDAGIGLTYDGGQFIYFTGQTASSNFPVSTGAFQTTFGGGSTDAFLARFDTAGARQWCTYIGSSSAQFGHGCSIDSLGNVIVVGTTGTGFPTTTGSAYPNYPGGTTSGFVIKFDDQGSRIWGTYFGTNTTAYDLICVGGDPIFVGWTIGSIPASTGAFQTARNGSAEDGFIARLNASGSAVLWATYFGGNQLEHITSIRVGNHGRLHMTGCTYSGNLPVTAGAYQTVYAGMEDRFVAIFNAAGQRCWASYIGGNNQDWCWVGASIGERPEHSIAIGSSGEFYAVGITAGNFPTTSGAFRSTTNGNDESFLMRFEPDCIGALTARAGNDTSVCLGGTARLGNTALASPCAQPLTYSWSPSTGLNRTDSSHVEATPTVTTTYIVTVTDADNCTDEDTVTVNITDLGADILPNPANMCAGGTRLLQATTGSGYTYTWFFNGSVINGATSSSYLATQAGDYRVRIASPSGCFDTSDTRTVSIIPGPGANITPAGPTSFCAGGSVLLQANTGSNYTYMWQRNGTTIPGANSSSYTATQAGNYRVIVTNTTSCSDTSSAITVSIIAGPGATITPAGPTTFCEGGSVLLAANTGSGYTYAWLRDMAPISGATSSTYLATQSGSYRVIVTNSAGCPDTSAAVVVTVVAKPGATVTASGPTSFCAGDRVLLNANTGTGYSYNWQRNGSSIGGSSGPTYTATQSGIYRVIVTNSAGCIDTSATVQVTVFPRPVAGLTAGGPTTFCIPDTVVLTATPASGVTYSWLKNDTAVAGADTRLFRAIRSGLYRVIVTDVNGCSDTSAAIAVTAYERPGATITGGPTSFCEDQRAILTANGGAGLTYLWQRNRLTIAGATSINFVATMSGAYRVVVTGPGGCTDTSDEITITVFPKPRVTASAAGPTVFCEPGSVVLNASAAGTVRFEWWMNGSPLPGETTASYTARQSGTYRVVAVDGNGCADTSAAIVVRVNPRAGAAIDPPGPTSFCLGGSLLLNATNKPGYSYIWQRDGTMIGSAAGPAYRVTQPGNYRVIITTPEGCTDTSAYTVVTVNPLPDQRIEGKTSVCPNSIASYFISDASGYEFEWSAENGIILAGRTSSRTDVRWPAPGTGRVRVRITNTATGCARDTMLDVSITTSLRPVITSNGPGILCTGDTLLLDAGAGYATYEWFRDGNPFGSRTRFAIVREAGVYTVAVSDSAGCSGISEPYQVAVNPKPVVRLAANGPTTVCEGERVQLFATSTPDATYTWYRDGGEILGETSDSLTATQPGRYRVAGVTKAGCRAESDPVDVIVKAAPIATLAALGRTSFCEGDSVTLVAKPETGVTYGWLRDGAPVGGNSGRLVARQAGLFRVIVTDIAAGCRDTSDVLAVGVFPPATIRITGDSVLCAGKQGLLRASGSAGQYRWTNGETTETITVSQSGFYEVTVTDSGGCTATAGIRVIVNPAPVLVIQGSRSMCRGSQTVLDARPGFVSYRWSTGATTQRLTVTTPGVYRVDVTDSAGCTASDSATVVESDRLTPTISGNLVLCPGSTVELEADSNDSYARYIWTTEADTTVPLGTLRRFAVTQPGRYLVRVVDRGGCSGSALADVRGATGGVRIQGRLLVCTGRAPDTLDAGPGFAAYRWSTQAATRTLLVTAPGRYSVEATDSNGCRWSDTVDVAERRVEPVIAGQTTICRGASTRLSVVYTGALSYEWSTGETTRDVVISDSGTVWARVVDSSGCEGTAFVTVRTATTLTPVVAGPRALCPGDSTLLDAGPGLRLCLWSELDTTVILSDARYFRTARAGSFVLRIADSGGCEGIDTIRVSVHTVTPPAVSRSGDTLVCDTRVSYQWLRGGVILPGATARQCVAADSGEYVVRVVDANGCTAESAPVRITRGTPEAAVAIGCPADVLYPPGALALARVELDGVSNLRTGGTQDFTLYVSTNPNILLPLFAASPAAGATLRIRGSRNPSLTRGLLVELPFRVVLGDAPCAPLSIDSLMWDDGTLTTVGADSCSICVEICREGGERLYSDAGALSLGAHPNPFNAVSTVEFTLIEAGASEVAVYDMLGRRVATIARGEFQPGAYVARFDATTLGSGSYICVLLTPSATRTLLLDVLK